MNSPHLEPLDPAHPTPAADVQAGSAALLTQQLVTLRDAVNGVRMPLELPGRQQALDQARQIVAQLDDYILPRIANIDAPLVAVVGGSTGAGKSTLVNSLIGRVVSKPGVIRPTTKAPVLVHNPDDEAWFSNDRILPGMIRSRVASQDQRTLQLVPEPTLPSGLAILDAPDIDSIDEVNRRLAAQLLDAADLWVFVTSAARYADAVPWDFLATAGQRGTAVAVVLDRVPPAGMQEIPPDLGRMMSERGLADAPLFAVPETITDERGLLPDAAVAPIRTFLATLAADKQERQRVVMQTLQGAIGSLLDRSQDVLGALDAQADVREQLMTDAAKSFAEASRAVAAQSSDGTLLKGEVLARWHDFVGANDLMRQLDQGIGRLRDRIGGFFRAGAQRSEDVTLAAGAGLEALIVEEAAAATERASQAWLANPAGRQIMVEHPELRDLSQRFNDGSARVIRDWQADVFELVSAEGQGKRRNARLAALGVNGAGAALMLVIFFSTGGITGLEGGVAVGSAALAQRLLESIFGDEAVRNLTDKAKSSLDARVDGLMAAELDRFTTTLEQYPFSRDQADRLRHALADIGQDQPDAATGLAWRQLQPKAQTMIESSAEPQLPPANPAALAGGGQLRQIAHQPDHEIVDAELVEAEPIDGQHPESNSQVEQRGDQR